MAALTATKLPSFPRCVMVPLAKHLFAGTAFSVNGDTGIHGFFATFSAILRMFVITGDFVAMFLEPVDFQRVPPTRLLSFCAG